MYSYSRSLFTNGFYPNLLSKEIEVSSISPTLTFLDPVDTSINIYFSSSLSVGEISTLDTIVNNHPSNTVMFNGQTGTPNNTYDLNHGYSNGDIIVNTVDNTAWLNIFSFPNQAIWSQINISNTGPYFSFVGFSAMKDNFTTNSSIDIRFGGFTGTSPYYFSDEFSGYSGTYIVPYSGKYTCKVMINYNVDSTITSNISSDINPQIILKRSGNNVISGNFPLIDVNIVLTLRVILSRGQIILSGDFNFISGDVLELFYVPDGLSLNINFSEIIWSMYKIS